MSKIKWPKSDKPLSRAEKRKIRANEGKAPSKSKTKSKKK